MDAPLPPPMIALIHLPYFPSGLADTLPGQADWWLAGFFYGISLCVAGEMIRLIRRARSGSDSP